MAKDLILPKELENDPLIHVKCKKVAVNQDSIEGMTKETDYKVVGTFVHIEYPGQTAKFSNKFYKSMPYFNKVLHDGEKVTIPLSVARFINERWAWQKPQHAQDERGNASKDYQPVARGKFIIEQHLKAA